MKISAKRLDGVPETLLYTLYMRYRESKRDDAIVKDGRFAEIVDLVDYDFSELALLPETAQLFVACRTLIFDTVARRFISENPEGLIVSLGAGLDFRFLRVDNGRITGVDIDLPGVIDLKKEIFPERDRWEFIPSSVLDFSWLDRIHSHGKKILFIAEGLLPYFDHEENGALISAISQNFPDSELIFDISSGYYQQMLEKNKSPYPFLKKIYSMAKGYIDHWKELEALEPGVRFITEYYPIDGYGDRGFGLPDESSLAPEEKPDPLPGQPEGDEAEELPEFMYELIRGLYRIIHIRTGVPEAFRVPEPVGYDWADDVV